MTEGSTDIWRVDLVGRSVLMFTIDYRVTLFLHGDATYDGSITLEQPFEVRTPDGRRTTLDPAQQAELGPVLACFGKVVREIAIDRQAGSLLLTFEDGTAIAASSGERYEAWEVNAPGLKVVASPGGGLAVWDEGHVPTMAEAEESVRQLFGRGMRIREITETGRNRRGAEVARRELSGSSLSVAEGGT
jgi:hypothetical protein